jgi:C4-dicarboxylate-specific signal transduction histidine kinase
VSDGEIQNIERDVLSKSGQPRTVLVHTKRVSIRNGTILYTCRDVTERKAAEVCARLAQAELAHASRLAVTGELIGSIVHEVTQPLSAISTTASTGLKLLENLGGTDLGALSDLLEEIRDQGRLAADVVDRLRALVRKQPLKLERLDANVVVRELQRLLDGQARIRQVTLSAELANSALMVMADRVSLQHVVLNLVLNGMDAVSQSRAARLITLRSRQVADGIEVSVADTGPGIPADTASRVFDPFFTTKRDGVGLGLTIARSLIQAQGGDISVSNGTDGGALFRVTLPAAVATEG